jgi:hypothetical protein
MIRFLSILLLVSSLSAAGATGTLSRRATIVGGAGHFGKCAIDVEVDGNAEVEIQDDLAKLRSLSGQVTVFRHFECSNKLPKNPAELRVVDADGRGSVRISQNPGSNGGKAIIRIEHKKGGRSSHSFDVEWRASEGGEWPAARGVVMTPNGSGFNMEKGIRICQDAAVEKLIHDGYNYVNIEKPLRTIALAAMIG